MEQTWRWFGPQDVVTLAQLRQAGATGVVTALHDIPYGEVWSVEAIRERLGLIAADASFGLRWSVVESLPVHERIKIGEGDLSGLFDAYRQSMRNLAACGVTTICYNFMPVLDWTRTELAHPLPGGGTALRFNAHEFAAFDCCMLERAGAEADHPPEVVARARAWFARSTPAQRARLLANIMAGLPGAYERYDIPALRLALARYRGIGRAELRANLVRFLREVIPTAEECGIRMAIHPDDPPRGLMGLPRIVSTGEDIAALLDAVPSPANGLTLCSGSLGAGPGNDVPAIAARFAGRIHFAHLRNVAKEPDGSFMEADHLGGDTDMVALVSVLLHEQARRKAGGDAHWRIPMRPDHGHVLLDDAGKPTHPGYPAIGRLRGLAEIRGVMTALAKVNNLPL
ncbi:MAG: mannonate dehydratase [Rhodospirillales bacterium 70-18]|nr:mannonate dehydratase [Rhodospirillales bacterium]OJY67300.1 MAG: mannonate dehydratase [Rhodospirillales bacterium 70-18]